MPLVHLAETICIYWWLVFGAVGWQLVVGDWRLVVGR